MEQITRINVSGATLKTTSYGDGSKAVLFVNGHTRASTDFRLLMKSMAEKGYRGISFDNRGSGETVTDRAFGLDDMVNDVAAVLAHEGLSAVHLFGVSMGGVIAQHFAAANPAMVRSLTLVSSTCQGRFVNLLHGWGSTFDEVRARLSKYVSHDFLARNGLLIDAMAKQVLKGILEQDFEAKSESQRQAIGSYDTTEVLPSIKQPVLILHGEEDRIISPQVVPVFCKYLPQAKAKVYPGVGHLLLAEAPRLLQQDLTSFLAEQI